MEEKTQKKKQDKGFEGWERWDRNRNKPKIRHNKSKFSRLIFKLLHKSNLQIFRHIRICFEFNLHLQ